MKIVPAPGRPPRLRRAPGRGAPLVSAALRPHSHLQHDFVQDHAIHQVHVDAEVVLVPAAQVPEGFHLPEEAQQGWGTAGGPRHPGWTGLPRGAPSLPAAALCSPRSPRGSAGRAPGAQRRSRPCRRGSGGGGRVRERGRLTRETKAQSPWPAAPLPAGRCLQGEQCAAHRTPAPSPGNARGRWLRSLLPTATGRSSPAELAPRLQ